MRDLMFTNYHQNSRNQITIDRYVLPSRLHFFNPLLSPLLIRLQSTVHRHPHYQNPTPLTNSTKPTPGPFLQPIPHHINAYCFTSLHRPLDIYE